MMINNYEYICSEMLKFFARMKTDIPDERLQRIEEHLKKATSSVEDFAAFLFLIRMLASIHMETLMIAMGAMRVSDLQPPEEMINMKES